MQQLGAAAVVASQLGGNDLKGIAQLFQARLLEIVTKTSRRPRRSMGGRPPDAAAIAALQKAVRRRSASCSRRMCWDWSRWCSRPMLPMTRSRRRSSPGATGSSPGVSGDWTWSSRCCGRGSRFLAEAQGAARRPAAAAGPGPDRRLRRHPRPRLPQVRRHRGRFAGQLSRRSGWSIRPTGCTGTAIPTRSSSATSARRWGRGRRSSRSGQGDYHSKVQPKNIHKLEWIVREADPARLARPALRRDRPGEGRPGQGDLPGPLREVPRRRPAGRARHLRRPQGGAGLGPRPQGRSAGHPQAAARAAHPRGSGEDRSGAGDELRDQRRPPAAAIHRRHGFRRGPGPGGVAVQRAVVQR